MNENSDSIGRTLYNEDDGLGMTKEQLINGFMRIPSTAFSPVKIVLDLLKTRTESCNSLFSYSLAMSQQHTKDRYICKLP